MAGEFSLGRAVVSAAAHVLLVEDEENVAYVVALALRHSGFEVSGVSTGSRGAHDLVVQPDAGHRRS